MRVCHLTSAHSRYDIRIFQKECISLARNGFDVSLIVCDGKENETVEAVKIYSVDKKRTGVLKRILHSPQKVLKKAMELDADIYCFHDPELLFVGNRLKKRGKDVIYDCHEFYGIQILEEKAYIPKCMRRFVSKGYNILEHYVAKRIDAILIPSTYCGKNVFDGIAKRTLLIGNYPKLEEFSGVNLEKKLSHTICYVGGLTYIRGIYHLIYALEKLDVHLILAGEFYPSEFKDEVEGLKGFEKVDYKGVVDRNGITKIIEKADIGMSTILNVGQNCNVDVFPTKVYEYMAMGIPVIISRYPYSEKMIEELKFGITVDPSDKNEISEGIKFLYDNPTQMKEMGKMGRKAIEERFNWEMEAKKLIELYEELDSKRNVRN